jgi:2-hydroxy-3-keto-5-methylthiopentenyl-1-phosphate phosphatase
LQLVLDWDGTCTVRDTLLMVINEFGDPSREPEWDAALAAGTMTHREVMEAELATVSVPLDEVVAYVVQHAELRPGFHELVAAHAPVILSSSFHETIEPVLQREAVRATVHANRVDARPEGWRIRWESDSDCYVCGQPCKRGALPAGDVVYVGDGFSDRCAAAAARRVFARDGLADYLRERALPFEPFDTLHDVARRVS